MTDQELNLETRVGLASSRVSAYLNLWILLSTICVGFLLYALTKENWELDRAMAIVSGLFLMQLFSKIFYFEDECVEIAKKEMRTPESVRRSITSRLRSFRPRFFRKR